MSIIVTAENPSIDPAVQRQVFGALPTGVTAITGLTVRRRGLRTEPPRHSPDLRRPAAAAPAAPAAAGKDQ
ncbi:hypothetical protein [Arthrobacter sp. NyZ413]|uniref:hypothetical protein n=1 Tax=Arthrobacter sp. NyZ413 TaxID=3144669 RepID=UPI002C9692C4|nr:hypothetical protein [Arthrobacter sp.]